MLFPILTALLALQAPGVFAASASDWRTRSVYQVMIDRFAQTGGSTTATCNTDDQIYCGGTWQGLINKLDYIQNMGFTAVWISPVTQQTNVSSNNPDGQSYHGYWQNDLYALNPAFGSQSDLNSLVTALHARKMYLMVDIVVNHFGWNGDSTGVDYSSYRPFNDSSYFHDFCQIQSYDYSNNLTAVQQCWMGDTNVELTDLNTTHPEVISEFNTWIKSLVSNYSIDGLRIDTVRNVNPDFFPDFVTASGVYAVGEIFDSRPSVVCPYQEASLPGVLNYPLYYSLNDAFGTTHGNMTALSTTLQTLNSSCSDTTLLGNFLENHDNPRFPSFQPDTTLAENAIGLSILSDGIPIIYQGQEQHYAGAQVPYNREAVWLSGYNTKSTLYTYIAKINQIRNHAISVDASYVTSKAQVIYQDTTTIAVRKGGVGAGLLGVWSNKGANGARYNQTIQGMEWKKGSVVMDVVGCRNLTVGMGGSVNVVMAKGTPKVFYPAAKLLGSGICGL